MIGAQSRRDVAHGLMFHRFRTGPLGSREAVSAEEFERMLSSIGTGRFLQPRAWVEKAAAGRLAPADLCVTFDDGLRSQIEVALPVLNALGLKAFWFVYSCVFEGRPIRSEIYSHLAEGFGGMSAVAAEFVRRCPSPLRDQLASAKFAEYDRWIRTLVPFYTDDDVRYRFLRNQPENRAAVEAVMDELFASLGVDVEAAGRRLWMTEADLKQLAADGHEIGLHSYDHPFAMSTLSESEQRDQYSRNLAHLHRVTGKRPETMSHPLDSYNKTSLLVLKDLGIRCGFRANMTADADGRLNPSALELAREDSANLLPRHGQMTEALGSVERMTR